MKNHESQHSNSNAVEDVVEEKVIEEVKAICGLDCEECQFYQLECLGCRRQRGRMFWGRCPIYRCCVYEKGLEFCAECSQFLCQKFLDQITTSIGL